VHFEEIDKYLEWREVMANKLNNAKLLEYVREGVIALMATSALIIAINLGLVTAMSVPQGVGFWVMLSSIALVISIFASAATLTGMINYLAAGESGGKCWLKVAQYASNVAVWSFAPGILFMLVQLGLRLA